MATHTPGPWSLSWISGAIRHINRNVDIDSFWFPDEGEDIDTAHYPSHNPSDYRLIASAPDLLSAAKEALEWIDSHTSRLSLDVQDSLRNAIAKAEGGKL